MLISGVRQQIFDVTFPNRATDAAELKLVLLCRICRYVLVLGQSVKLGSECMIETNQIT